MKATIQGTQSDIQKFFEATRVFQDGDSTKCRPLLSMTWQEVVYSGYVNVEHIPDAELFIKTLAKACGVTFTVNR